MSDRESPDPKPLPTVTEAGPVCRSACSYCRAGHGPGLLGTLCLPELLAAWHREQGRRVAPVPDPAESPTVPPSAIAEAIEAVIQARYALIDALGDAITPEAHFLLCQTVADATKILQFAEQARKADAS